MATFREDVLISNDPFDTTASSRRDDIESLLFVLLYLMRGDLPWQDASSDADGASVKKSTTIASLCATLASGWSDMLQNIRECGFEDRPDYDFFELQFEKLAQGQVGSSGPFQWGNGNHRTATSVSNVSEDYCCCCCPMLEAYMCVNMQASNGGRKTTTLSATKRSVTASPEPKRAKSGASAQSETTTKTATTKAVVMSISRPGRVGAQSASNKKAARKSKPQAAESALEQSSESDEADNVKVLSTAPRVDPDRRQKAVQKALAGAAAAKAAAKRAENGSGRTYNLRSASSNGSS